MSSLSSADPMPFDCGRASSRARFHPRSQLRKIEWLTAAAQARDCDWVRRALVQIVPEYAPSAKREHADGAATEYPARKNSQKMRPPAPLRPEARHHVTTP